MIRTLVTTVLAVVAMCVLLLVNAQAHPAWGIVIDRNNQIYFSDIETIWKIDAQGKLTVFRAGVDGRHTHEISLGEDGNIYGVDNAYDPTTQRSSAALWKMTPAGEFSLVLAPTNNPPKALTNWKDRAGNSFYVGTSDNTGREIFILKRTPDGKVTTLAGNRKAGDKYIQVALYSVGGMAFGSDGALYFTDNSNVRKVTMDGRMTMLAENLSVENRADSPITESTATRLFGIAVDAQGNAFVAGYGNRRVLKIAPGGGISTVARAEQPWSPTGVAFKDGNLYILEFGFTPPSKYVPRVRKLAADGKITVLATVDDAAKASVQRGNVYGTVEVLSTRRRGATYALVGAVAGVFVLAIAAWRARKRILTHQ